MNLTLLSYPRVWLLSSSLILLAYAEKIDEEEHRLFADAFTKELFSKRNECSSTWGVSMLMDLLRPGAGGTETVEELCDGMALCGGDKSLDNGLLWADTVERLTTTYDGRCTSEYNGKCLHELPTLAVANSVWIDNGDTLAKAYGDIVGDQLHQIDFSDAKAGENINSWAKESTKGLLEEIIDDGEILYNLVAVNSIYLKASWEKQFQTQKTNVDLFYTNPTRTKAMTTRANFMHQVDNFMYSGTALPGFQVIKLDYANSFMSMLIALPTAATSGSAAGTLAVAATATDVVAALSSLKTTKVALALPKFKFLSEYNTQKLKGAFKSVGITKPFNETEADFCSLVKDECLYIDEMIQKTSIEVDELGTVAAAVTAAGVYATSLPKPETPVLFQADYPFSFFIYDEIEDLVLFEGRVGGGLKADSSAAQLKSEHLDSNFWEKHFGVQPN